MKINKIIATTFILILIFNVKASAADNNSYKFKIKDYTYSMELPRDWTAEKYNEQSNHIRFYKGEVLTGGFFLENSNLIFSQDTFVEEINTVLGKCRIYRIESEKDRGVDMLYGYLDNGNASYIYIYTNKKNMHKDLFILKMLLLNISKV
ncbi:hypothetical protein [Clostridium polynesiense]|uniref:hypothetical protein n=1 Tax=Clostridium polynesiense TaxID=1325933 RepID=UPI00058B402D|nr:hypothetical protein [Clostridium polynesiense]